MSATVCLQLARVGVDRLERCVVAFRPRDLEQLSCVAQAGIQPGQGRYDVLERLAFASQFLRALADRSRERDLRDERRLRRGVFACRRSQRYLRSSVARASTSASRRAMALILSASMREVLERWNYTRGGFRRTSLNAVAFATARRNFNWVAMLCRSVVGSCRSLPAKWCSFRICRRDARQILPVLDIELDRRSAVVVVDGGLVDSSNSTWRDCREIEAYCLDRQPAVHERELEVFVPRPRAAPRPRTRRKSGARGKPCPQTYRRRAGWRCRG